MKNLDWIKENFFAHRGLHNESIPENTMAAFLHAVEKGYHIELDIRYTKDNKLVVVHDKNLKRLCQKDINVDNSNYKEIKDLTILNTKETIPLLETVLNMIPDNIMFLLELKPSTRNKEFVSTFLKVIRKYRHKYAIHSFDPRIVRQFKIQAPDIIRGQIAKDYRIKGKSILRSFTLLLLGITKPDFINYKFIDLPYSRLDKLKDKGMMILSYTAKSPEDLAFVRNRYDNAVFEDFEPKKKA